jgi:hypothetical protein
MNEVGADAASVSGKPRKGNFGEWCDVVSRNPASNS